MSVSRCVYKVYINALSALFAHYCQNVNVYLLMHIIWDNDFLHQRATMHMFVLPDLLVRHKSIIIW